MRSTEVAPENARVARDVRETHGRHNGLQNAQNQPRDTDGNNWIQRVASRVASCIPSFDGIFNAFRAGNVAENAEEEPDQPRPRVADAYFPVRI